jgi:hypothetical protein
MPGALTRGRVSAEPEEVVRAGVDVVRSGWQDTARWKGDNREELAKEKTTKLNEKAY